jgi:Xaa-Pro aminopeptidase
VGRKKDSAMNDLASRVNAPISTKELERRWAAIRAAMTEQKIDVLLMQNNNDFLGGYVKFFTDVPAVCGYPVSVVFPKDDLMTVIRQGGFGMDKALAPEGDGLFRGVKRVLGAPYFASAHFTWGYDAALVEKTLLECGGTIGLVGLSTLPVSMIDRLRQGRLGKAKFVDASELVDKVKCIKSEEELSFVRRTATLQDQAISEAFKAVKPGKRDVEIAAIAEQVILNGGGEQSLLITSSHAPGEPLYWNHRHLQNRVLHEGDLFSLLVETNGPGGFYTEISRTAVLGKVTQVMQDEFEMLLEARKFTLSLLKPGASCKEIWGSYNEFLRQRGKPEESRLYCHGQGYDLVERPLVRNDEPMKIHKNMNMTCHPTWINNGIFNTICDNFLIGDAGVVERLHTTAEKLLEVG